MDAFVKLENMPITYIVCDDIWEMMDELTGEIFNFTSERGAKMLRAFAVRTDRIPWDFYRVRSDHRNGKWDEEQYFPFGCHCCGLELRIDEYNFCDMCLSEGHNKCVL